MSRALVIAGCLSGEKNDTGIAALVGELAAAVGADVAVRARTGGRPVGATLPDVLAELRDSGVRRALVTTTHVVDGRLQREAETAARNASPGFESLCFAAPLLATEKDHAAAASALDAAFPARPGRVVALAGHRGPECEAAFARLESALAAAGRPDALVDSPERLFARLVDRPEREVLLGPFLMSLGAHARRDVLVDLRAALERAGLVVEPWSHSLAELPAVRALVVAHALAACPS